MAFLTHDEFQLSCRTHARGQETLYGIHLQFVIHAALWQMQGKFAQEFEEVTVEDVTHEIARYIFQICV